MPRKPKPRTQSQIDAVTDTRLRKTYGISLEEYETLLKDHDGGCWICGSKPVTRRLHVDHDHSWTKAKIYYRKCSEEWEASAEYNGGLFVSTGKRKADASRIIKQDLKRASVRGLLCFPDNKGLQKFSDNPTRLRNAAKYLENFLMYTIVEKAS